MLKRRLIQEAVEMVEEGEELSMRRLASRLHVSAMAAYRHFPHKDAILLEVAAAGFDRLTRTGDRAAADSRSGHRLIAVMEAYFLFGTRHRNLFELMFGPLRKKESASYAKAAKASYARFTHWVSHHTGLAGNDLNRTAAGTWAFMHGLTVLAASGFLGTDPRAFAREQIADHVRRMP